MSTFEAAIPVIMAHEGGWVNDPSDLGAETNFGWSTSTIKSLGLTAADLGIPGPMFSPGYLKPMKPEVAVALYRKEFWDKFGFGAILDQTTATKCMDCAVNCGPKRSAKISQGAVNTLLPGRLVVDGAFGPMTFGAINSIDGKKFVKAMATVMADYYNSIAISRPQNSKFLPCWLKRAKWGVVV